MLVGALAVVTPGSETAHAFALLPTFSAAFALTCCSALAFALARGATLACWHSTLAVCTPASWRSLHALSSSIVRSAGFARSAYAGPMSGSTSSSTPGIAVHEAAVRPKLAGAALPPVVADRAA